MNHLEIYEKSRSVPQEAQKRITGGRLNGMTDINPMWRIKKLTELFGPCGVGWKYVIREKRVESLNTSEAAAFVDVDLYIRWEGEWSDPIPGTGGSLFVTQEKNGVHMSDECYKMALTDAISVACKALGFGADVYWEKDPTKYTGQPTQPKPDKPKRAAKPEPKPEPEPKPDKPEESPIEQMKRYFAGYKKKSGLSGQEILYAIQSDTGIDLNRPDLTMADVQAVTKWIIAAGKALKAENPG